jgi:flagellar biogenesis protein FliO
MLRVMESTQTAPTEQVTTTTATFYHWLDTPMTVALIFALAGAIFVGIYLIRRLRSGRHVNKQA